MSGLEVLGIAAGIIQVADTGLRLSQAVYKYIEDTKGADKRLATFAQDVRRTAEIIQSVGALLQDESARERVAAKGLATAQSCVEDCKAAFGDVDAFVLRARGKGKWLFSFREPKLLLLDARLEKLKSNLSLMLLVLGKSEELKVALELKEKKDEASKEALGILMEFKAAKVTASRAQLQYEEIEARATRASEGANPASADNSATSRGSIGDIMAKAGKMDAARMDNRRRSASDSSVEAPIRLAPIIQQANNPASGNATPGASRSMGYAAYDPQPFHTPATTDQAQAQPKPNPPRSVVTSDQFARLVNELTSTLQTFYDQINELQSSIEATDRAGLSRIEYYGMQQVASNTAGMFNAWARRFGSYGGGHFQEGPSSHMAYGGMPSVGGISGMQQHRPMGMMPPPPDPRGQMPAQHGYARGQGGTPPGKVNAWSPGSVESDNSFSDYDDSDGAPKFRRRVPEITVDEPVLKGERLRLRAWEADGGKTEDADESVEDLLREWTNVYEEGEKEGEEKEGRAEDSSEAE